MPLPKPTQEENRAEFISRCMSNDTLENDFPDTDQRLAVCGDIFDQSRERTMTVNERLLAAVKSRQPKMTQFFRGILTADWYVKSVRDHVSPEMCHKYMATRHASFDDVLKKAASTLVYSNTDMEVEEIYGQKVKMPKGVELPKNTLMVFRHVLTTSLKDRDGDILRTEGAEIDPKMLLLWQHVHTMPIGKMLAEVKRTKSRLELCSAIVDVNEICHDAAVMVDNKMGRFSHGFRTMEFEELKPDKGEDESTGFDIKRFEIMEESLVSVPANPDAETTDVLLSLVEDGKLTSPMMKEYGKTIRAGLPKTVPGVEIKMKEKFGDWERELSCGSLSDLKAAHDAGLIGVKTDEDESGSGSEEAGEGSPGSSEQKSDEGEAEKEIASDEEVKEIEDTSKVGEVTVEVKVELEEEKAGRSLSKANEERLKEAKSIVDEVIDMKDLLRPAKAMLREATTALDAILIGLVGDDGEAEALTVEKATAKFLSDADRSQRSLMVKNLQAIERAQEKQKRLAKFRSLKRSG